MVNTNASDCIECGARTFVSFIGATACQICPMSLYSINERNVHCEPCNDIAGATCSDGVAYIDASHHAYVLAEKIDGCCSDVKQCSMSFGLL